MAGQSGILLFEQSPRIREISDPLSYHVNTTIIGGIKLPQTTSGVRRFNSRKLEKAPQEYAACIHRHTFGEPWQES
jgi:hypothetical protein